MSNTSRRNSFVILFRNCEILFNSFKFSAFQKIKESYGRRVVQVKPICQGGSPLMSRIEETAVRWQVCYDVRQDTRNARGEPDVQE